MDIKNNKFEKYSDDELKLLLALGMHDDGILAQNNFLHFVRIVWPDFIGGYHSTIMAEKFEEIANGTLKRLIINMPPRHGKS